MFNSRDKQRPTLSGSETYDGHRYSDSVSSESPGSSKRGMDRYDPEPIVQVRWVRCVLAILVIACLLLAAWVWFEILHV